MLKRPYQHHRHRVASALVYTHRWLGIAGGAVFVIWFASGIVMMYARMPALDPARRLAALPAIDVASIRAPFRRLAEGDSVSRFTIGTFAGRPVYRALAGRRWRVVFADSGEELSEVTPEQAIAAAAQFAGGHGARPTYDARLDDADQWSFGVRGLMPMHRVSLGDADDTRVYVSAQTADIVLTTTAAGRRWGYLGAVLHWIYFTPFRRQAALWSETIIWTSIAGTLLALTGLAWGLWRFSPAGGYHFKGRDRRTPYVGWMRWHHYAGLLFGVTTATWVFSGLLSMDPWSWSPSTAPTRAQREAVSGGPLDLSGLTPSSIAAALSVFGPAVPKEVELTRFRGEQYLRADSGLVPLSAPAHGVLPSIDRHAIAESARDAMPGTAIVDAVWLDRYDAYYYSRSRAAGPPLPVLRVRYADPQATWLYFDPSRGAVVRKEERLSRVNRWLYHGLHSLDFPFLYARRPLWDVIVIALSLGGIVLSVTTMAAGWRRVRRRMRFGRIRAGSV